MKIAAAAILILAIVIGVVPQFTDCQSQGRALALTNGKTVPMKCHWTAQAALATTLPLLGLGTVKAVSRRKESRRIISALGVLLGGAVILLPTYLIGVCASADMLCNSVLKPTLILAGTLIVAISLVSWFVSERRPEQIA